MDKETFIKFERSAKFELSDEERGKILSTVNLMLKQFDSLSEIDTENVEPLISVLGNQTNILRADVSKKLVDREELLKLAPETNDGYFVVPKTVD